MKAELTTKLYDVIQEVLDSNVTTDDLLEEIKKCCNQYFDELKEIMMKPFENIK